MSVPASGTGDPESSMLSVFVPGRPAPQGSKDYMGRSKSGKGILVESSKAVKPWRADVREALLDSRGAPLARFAKGVPVFVTLTFILPRPKSYPKRHVPATKKPDLDKLTRAVLDAMTSAGVLHDDSQVTMLSARKRIQGHAELDPTGCLIMILEDA
jgi:crossover junction endodeoxyribonuclease RusA